MTTKHFRDVDHFENNFLDLLSKTYTNNTNRKDLMNTVTNIISLYFFVFDKVFDEKEPKEKIVTYVQDMLTSFDITVDLNP